MTTIEGIQYGFEIAISWENILAALVGAVGGTVLGVLPGLGPVGGAAILLPLTFSLSPTAGVIMIAGIYYGIMYGGSTSAVLVNMPGEASSVVAGFDGHPMAKDGRAGVALGLIAIASFIAGTLSVTAAVFLMPYVARIGVDLGAYEYFAMTLGGLIILSRMFSSRLSVSMLPMTLGLAMGTVGVDGVTGAQRFTFGVLTMRDGIDLVAMAVGIFGVSELMLLVRKGITTPMVTEKIRLRNMIPTRDDFRRSRMPWLRGSVIGFFIGLLPGPSAAMSTFASYRTEVAISKDKSRFGKGAVEGLAGPEAANNAAATSSIIPLLALGLPFSATLALVIAGLMAHGIMPGPLLAVQHPEIFWGVLASMYLGNVMLLVLNIPMIGIWASFLRIPVHYLVALVSILALAGAFSSRFQMLDMYWVVLFGVMGYILRRYGYPLAPLLLGLILGPLVERYFSTGMMLQRGEPLQLFFATPIATVIWILVIIVVVAPTITRTVRKKRELVDA